ncbi:MAG TPA: hypothetical protein VLE53_07440 [Gemmatimonadaceae bacterium]|nr:hypothetical protein [Gemmatimonadaceae bacterium]
MGAPWLVWGGIWLVSCLAAIAVLLARRAPTIWRGTSLLRFTAALALVAVAATIVRGGSRTSALLVAMVALLLGSWWLRHHALVSGHDMEELRRTVEGSARRVNLRPQPVPRGYLLALPAGGLQVTFRAIGRRLFLVTMRAVPPHRKAELFVRLFGKQYRGVLPTVVIRD